MNKIINYIIVLFIFTFFAYAMETVSIAPFPWMTVKYEGEATVYNTSLEKLAYEDPFYHANGDTSSYIKVLDIIPDASTGNIYSILFKMGEGGYARYEFYRDGECVIPAFILQTDHLEIPGNGILITHGSMGQMFNITKKYRISDGVIKELKQPFYSVDIDSKATKDFNIYLTKRLNRIVDQINKGENVKVVLSEFNNKHEFYLVRSERGLVGWIKVEQETWVDETPIKDLYYHGD